VPTTLTKLKIKLLKAQIVLCAPLAIRFLISINCMWWAGIFEKLSENEGRAKLAENLCYIPAAQPSQAEQLIDVILIFFMGDKSK
jgi:hypothetical protein